MLEDLKDLCKAVLIVAASAAALSWLVLMAWVAIRLIQEVK